CWGLLEFASPGAERFWSNVRNEVTAFAVLDQNQKEIVDTNGAGDAFVGGTNSLIPCLLISQTS
ncbi:hypothetical protein STEG23_023967, partial [Scotinomys teguina]